MEVVSQCSLPVAGRVWRPRPGAFVLTFVCKATFAFAPGKLSLAAEQQPVHEVDRPWSDSVTSLYAAADLVPRKLRADVVLIGSAFAPGGVPVRMLVARLTVGDVSKAVEVSCDRQMSAEGVVVDGAAFAHLPLLYERAAGGPGTDNPVGIEPEPDEYGSVALPNLTQPGAILAVGVPIAPVGFGPLGARWPSRLVKLGRYADELSGEGWLDAPLPPDFNMAYFNVAPADQQPSLLRGDERVLLENLHPEHAQLSMTLPGLQPRAKVSGPSSERSVPMRCDTLWIDTSRGTCCLTYRGEVLLGSAADPGWVVVTLDADKEAPRPSGNFTGTLAIDEPTVPPQRSGSASTLPFVPSHERPLEREAHPMGGLPFQAPIVPFHPEPSGLAPVPAPAAWSPPAAPPLVPVAPALVQPAPVKIPAPDSPWAAQGNVQGAGTIAPVIVAPAPSKEPARPLIGGAPIRAPTREGPADALDLVFFDAASLPRMRRVPAWKKLLAKLDERPLDTDEDDPATSKDPGPIEDRREVLEILVHAEATDAVSLDEALGRAVREDGRFHAPILLLTGELTTPFDEVETLKSTITTVTPLIGNDENLRASVGVAKEFLALPGLSSSPAVTEGLTGRVRDAFNAGKRAVPAGYLDAQTERALLEQRAYQRRMVLGARRQRALFHFAPPPQGAVPIVTYLPDDVAPKLPMFTRFKVRFVARVHLPLDQFEQGSMALEALALSRLVASPRRPS